MNHQPAITVLLPVFNAERYVREAIRSVLDQTFQDFELLIIDDASTDESARIIASFSDPRIRVLRHDRNAGLIASLNEGLTSARGSFIARMDADDVMLPERLSRQHAYLQTHQEVAVVAAFVVTMNADGETTGVWDIDRATRTEEEIRRMMPRTNCIAHPSVMIRKDALAGLSYSTQQPGAEDWDLWMRLLSRGGRIAKIPEVLLNYRMHATSAMGVQKAQRSLEGRLWRVRQRFLLSEWGRLRLSLLQLRVIKAQVRTMARHLRLNVWPSFSRDLFRIFTYSPVALTQERRCLREALATWKGEQVFLFPYVNAGGAEQVHVDIIAASEDVDPLVIICGFSTDRAFADRFAGKGRLLELPRLLNHPWTRSSAVRRIASAMNERRRALLFSSLTNTFFELLPQLGRQVRTMYLQHAFLFQPAGNLLQKRWLPLFPRIDRYLFVSQQAKLEFERFLFTNNIPRSAFGKLLFMPNCVHAFGAVADHERIGLLFVGRDSPEKRVGLFLDLSAQLEKAYPGRFRFTVAGAKRTGHPQVSFAGLVSDPLRMSALYSAHDLLVVTSDREGFPMVIMEAMAHGCVILNTPVGDIPGRMDPSFAHVTSSVEHDTVLTEMTDAALRISDDRETLRRMREAALAFAKDHFDEGAFQRRYRELFNSPASPA